MPTALFSINAFHASENNEKVILQATTLNTVPVNNERTRFERQLAQGSIHAALRLTEIVDYGHDTIRGCFNCDLIASYYMEAIQIAKQKEPVLCSSILVKIVQQSIELVQLHSDTLKTEELSWVSLLVRELRELGKQIKDECSESDIHVPLPLTKDFINEPCKITNINEEYRRAVRITIYHCRAVMYEETDISKAIVYYRKCVSVRATQFEYQRNLQQLSKTALTHLLGDSDKSTASFRPLYSSRTSSVSSGASSSCPMKCANCGVEKRGMPVCSKCKSQYYCGIRCLKTHKPIHDTECH
jgi:hypothetical protein